jgi:hypothetical protein
MPDDIYDYILEVIESRTGSSALTDWLRKDHHALFLPAKINTIDSKLQRRGSVEYEIDGIIRSQRSLD